MESLLPKSIDFLPTHPMFGPDSASESLDGRKIVLCPGRIGAERLRGVRRYLSQKGLTVIETTPDEHDRQMAVSLSLTHFIGRSLAEYGARPLDMDTEGYQRLLHILGVVEHDSWELFSDMHRFNPYAADHRRAFMTAAERIEALLSE
jgi:prephenate dehydrogenase